MGRNNKQRRAASRRKRRRDGRQPRAAAPPGDEARDGGPRPMDTPLVEEPPPARDLLWAVARAADVAAHLRVMLPLLSERLDEVLTVLDAMLAEIVNGLWGRGWAPADVVRVAQWRLSSAHARVAARLVLDDGHERARRGEGLHEAWLAQLQALEQDAHPPAPPPGERLVLGVELLGLLARAGTLPRTVPRPGDRAARAPLSRLDGRVLARVRALLSKAESTEFEQEAEALTAKAQELIARHAIDEALLTGGAGEPSLRRVPVDRPYADAKASLLARVAEANRCRVVYSPDCGWVTMVGYDADLDAVELLAASLLAQVTRAMAAHGSWRDAQGRSRTRSFRRSFLFGFAARVGERLREATGGQVASATREERERLLPVLHARDDRIEEAVAEAFPRMVELSGAIGSELGWVAGQAAAELADLTRPADAVPPPAD
jgi:hypothetical protein